ncbi:SAM-dependent methyltransferase [Mycobacterium sp. TNTM28]|uniref:S-adenosyl-L-methionine-dependent methyltransferase n=1 Tax=[Mycobacterium] fortunisiensis TaxID=2600579 RepID=A0ABS6KFN4_9MYCO|nr:SAM-dependent methyltransferase [[Mycobacterium] fortunisiensis]MBU9762374.1 SAM-dependent methyltransferase [[Mycobacterium] fortunisiensis]
MPSSCTAHPTHPLDHFLLTSVSSGIPQVVFLASDLDPRPYQLDWPADTAVYVVDDPAILEVKTAAVADITPTTAVCGVPAGISDNWTAALAAAGFDAHRPTLWSVEGVLPFIPMDEQRRLVADITALSAPASRLISEISVSPFGDAAEGDDAEVLDVERRWRETADADTIMKWQWSFSASPYVTAYLTSERPTSEHEAVETVLDPVDHRRGGAGRRIHGDAGAHVLRHRRRVGHLQRQGR